MKNPYGVYGAKKSQNNQRKAVKGWEDDEPQVLSKPKEQNQSNDIRETTTLQKQEPVQGYVTNNKPYTTTSTSTRINTTYAKPYINTNPLVVDNPTYDYEKKIIDDVLKTSGISSKPMQSQIQEFIKKIKSLNETVVFNLINERIAVMREDAKMWLTVLIVIEEIVKSPDTKKYIELYKKEVSIFTEVFNCNYNQKVNQWASDICYSLTGKHWLPTKNAMGTEAIGNRSNNENNNSHSIAQSNEARIGDDWLRSNNGINNCQLSGKPQTTNNLKDNKSDLSNNKNKFSFIKKSKTDGNINPILVMQDHPNTEINQSIKGNSGNIIDKNDILNRILENSQDNPQQLVQKCQDTNELFDNFQKQNTSEQLNPSRNESEIATWETEPQQNKKSFSFIMKKSNKISPIQIEQTTETIKSQNYDFEGLNISPLSERMVSQEGWNINLDALNQFHKIPIEKYDNNNNQSQYQQSFQNRFYPHDIPNQNMTNGQIPINITTNSNNVLDNNQEHFPQISHYYALFNPKEINEQNSSINKNPQQPEDVTTESNDADNKKMKEDPFGHLMNFLK